MFGKGEKAQTPIRRSLPFLLSFPQGICFSLCYPSPVANPEHLARLSEGVLVWNEWRTSNQDLEIDLSEADLSGWPLTGAYLSNANLNAANLSGAQLQRAKLKQADLQNSNLRDADLSNANLSRANLQGATLTAANLRDAALIETKLVGTKLIRADMQAADLRKADLTGARLFRTNLSGANLSEVNMGAAEFLDTNLKGANLSRSILNEEAMRNSDLIGANLSGVDLSGLTLSSAKLNRVDFRGADLRRANLRGANLSEANLSHADLGEAMLGNANLSDAILIEAQMSHIDLRRATLDHANLSQSNMTGADLSGTQMHQTNFTRANLHRAVFYNAQLINANLKDADISCANLQSATLDQSDLTGACLWETQRAGWRIAAIACERIFWDKGMKVATEYAPGEFERLYSEQTSFELFYKGGISTFELNTLPALLQHLASKHPDTNIQLKTIEQTGGGAKITINLGDADEETKQTIQTSAAQVQQIQLSLRESEGQRLQLEVNFNRLLDTFTNALLASAPSQIHFHAPVHTAALPSGNATIELHQTFNDNTELIQLIDKLLTRNAELTAPQSAEIESVKAELQKPDPDKSLLTRTLGFLKTLPKEAILKGAGKLGEKAAEADWSNLLHQLGEFIHHL
jgi:uncharacterized protein YjbI with pentapeptide repeats